MDAEPPAGADDEAFRAEARALYERVASAAVPLGEGVRWPTVEPPVGPGDGRTLSVLPDSGSLYTGGGGIALLGAALYHLTGEDRYREFARSALAPVRAAVGGDRRSGATRSLGGTTGIGSVAYALAVAGDLLDSGQLLDEAVTVAGSVTDELLASDDTYDVVGGAAGTILGLLAVHDRRADRSLVSAATDCVEHLLDERVAVDGVRVWETLPARQPLTGFAHGQAGIAYALARLHGVTGRERYREAALEAVAYEDRTYSPEVGNWPDFREVVEPDTYPDQWCHGRSGVGLARLGTASAVDDERVERDVDRALSALSTSPVDDHDHLCCGEAGRASFLLEVERRRGRQAGAARRRLGAVLDRKRSTGAYRTLAATDAAGEPTLFRGFAGIGYSMLRVTAPDALPCLLLWE